MTPSYKTKYGPSRLVRALFIELVDCDSLMEIGDLDQFCGFNWGRADAKDVHYPHEDESQIVVYNSMLKQWLCVPRGWWIVEGFHGELWPVDSETFDELYDCIG